MLHKVKVKAFWRRSVQASLSLLLLRSSLAVGLPAYSKSSPPPGGMAAPGEAQTHHNPLRSGQPRPPGKANPPLVEKVAPADHKVQANHLPSAAPSAVAQATGPGDHPIFLPLVAQGG